MREALWIELEVLTPTHVGNGTEINPVEYWIDERFARVQMDGLFADPLFAPYLDTFISKAASQRYLGQHLPADLIRGHILYHVPIAPDARQYIVQHQVVVKEYVKTAGRVYIPGSSIKGSLLSALIHCVLGEECRSSGQRESIEQCIEREGGFSRLLDISIGGLRGAGVGKRDRFYRWLDVSDSSLSQPDESLNIYYSEVVGARKGNLPILFEGLVPGSAWIFSLAAGPESRFNLTEILKVADSFYREVWKKSGINEAPPANGFLLRLGQGSSAWATSLLLFAEAAGLKYSLKPPRTRKLVDARTPMGWVMLTPKTNDKSTGFETHRTSAFKFETHTFTVKNAEVPPAPPISGKPLAPIPSPLPSPQKRRLPAALDLDVGPRLSAKALLGMVARLIPSDKIGFHRIIDALDGLEKQQASEVAIALRERLLSLGQWEKNPKRFDIECFIEGE